MNSLIFYWNHVIETICIFQSVWFICNREDLCMRTFQATHLPPITLSLQVTSPYTCKTIKSTWAKKLCQSVANNRPTDCLCKIFKMEKITKTICIILFSLSAHLYTFEVPLENIIRTMEKDEKRPRCQQQDVEKNHHKNLLQECRCTKNAY